MFQHVPKFLKTSFLAVAAGLIASPSAFAGKSDDTFNIAFESEVASLDYYMGSSRNNLILARHIYDTLILKNLETNEFVPALAESFRIVDDTTLEFVIRDGVKFHDGTTMTADDVVYTLNTVADPDYGAVYQIAVRWIDKAEKTGPRTVRLSMKQPYPPALEWLAGFLPIYPKSYYEEVGREGMGLKPIGTGPYKLVSMEPGIQWTLSRFDEHYSESPKGRPPIKNLDIRVLPEMNSQLAELMTGTLDFIWRVPADQAERLRGRPGIEVKTQPILRVAFLHMNTVDDSPLKDRRVREAILRAIDRETIKSAFWGAGSEVVHTPCNPRQFGCVQDVAKYSYDPDKARMLLSEAGHGDGFSLKVLTGPNPLWRRSGEAIAGELAKVGITLDYDHQQYASHREMWDRGGVPLSYMSWGSWGIGDVAMITSYFFRDDKVNKVRDPEIMEWLATADTTMDAGVRLDAYGKAIRKVAEEVYWIPLWTHSVGYAIRDEVDFSVHSDEILRFFTGKWN